MTLRRSASWWDPSYEYERSVNTVTEFLLEDFSSNQHYSFKLVKAVKNTNRVSTSRFFPRYVHANIRYASFYSCYFLLMKLLLMRCICQVNNNSGVLFSLSTERKYLLAICFKQQGL